MAMAGASMTTLRTLRNLSRYLARWYAAAVLPKPCCQLRRASPVEVRNDTVGEVRVGITVLVNQIIDDVERPELVVGITFVIAVIIRMVVFIRGFAVPLVLELEFFFVLFRVLFEERIPSVDLVERLVEQILLALTIDTVMFRNLVLVSYL